MRMRRLSWSAITLALASAALTVPLATVSAPAANAAVVETKFGLLATGYGARVSGGPVPVSSNNVGWSALACTNKAGLERGNYVAAVDVPQLGKVNGVRTRVWTTRSGSRVNSWSEHTVAGINLLDVGLFKLDITGIKAESRAWWDGAKFRATTRTNVLGITLTLDGQKPQELKLPTPGNPIKVPGVLEIALGKKVNTVKSRMARATAHGLSITVYNGQQPDTVIKVARTVAQIERGVSTGVFRGWAAGIRGNVLDGTVGVGRTPLRNMPCVGTDGQTKYASVATLGGGALGNLADVSALSASVKGDQDSSRAKGNAIAKVAGISLLGGRIKVEGIKAQANVTRQANGTLLRNANGSSVASITVDGKTYPVALDKILTIPGLVKIDARVTRRTDHGLEVVGVRIELLGEKTAVLELGVVRLEILKS